MQRDLIGSSLLTPLLAWALAVVMPQLCLAEKPVSPALRLHNPQSRDQDDFCVWVHPQAPEQSLLITSDKAADAIFVYDLQGNLLQTVAVPQPGNIDSRHGVKLSGVKPDGAQQHGQALDLVVVNQRRGFQIVPFQVNPATRRLVRLNDTPLETGRNYGGCLYQSSHTGRLYFFCTSDHGPVEQYELKFNDQGRMVNTKVRELKLGKCEGAVADDATGTVYIAAEHDGIWKFNGEPTSTTPPELIARVGDGRLRGDLEGLALVPRPDGSKWLVVSDQGRNCFVVYSATTPHAFIGEFTVTDAKETDGIEIITANLGPAFPRGIFGCHTDKKHRPTLIVSWAEIESALEAGQKTP